MIIDDDEPTNFISKILFEEADCTRHLEVLNSGLKALDYFTNNKPGENKLCNFKMPDLVFLDINMPCMNGWEFLEEYKKIKNRHLEKPVIILLTTSLNPDDRLRAENNPEVSGFESKPLTAEIIKRIVKTHFDPAVRSVATML